MTGGDWFGSTLLTLLVPGFGQGVAGRRARMLAFAIGSIVTTIAILWSVWLLPVTLAVRIGAAIDAGLLLRRHTIPSNRVLAGIAIAIGVVNVGWHGTAYERFKIPSSSMYPGVEIGDEVLVDKVSVYWRPIERGEIIVFEQPCAKRPYVKRVIALAGDTVEVRCNSVYVNGVRIAEQVIEPHTSYSDYDVNGTWFERRCSRYRETHGGHTYDVFHDEDRPEHDRARDLEQGDARDFPKRDVMIAPSCQHSDFYESKPGASKQPIGQLVVTKPIAQPCEQQAHFVVPANALFMMGDNRNNANDSRYWGAVSVDAVIGRAIGVYYSKRPGGDIQWNRIGAVR
jgi:signal peptidase I